MHNNNCTCEEVCHSQVTEQVVDGIVKPPVLYNGPYDQKVGKHDNEGHRQTHSDDHIVARAPVIADVLATRLVEKLHSIVAVAFAFIRRRSHVGSLWMWDQRRAEEDRRRSDDADWVQRGTTRAPFRLALGGGLEIGMPSAGQVRTGGIFTAASPTGEAFNLWKNI